MRYLLYAGIITYFEELDNAVSSAGLNFGHLAELLCLKPAFDLTVAARQAHSFAVLAGLEKVTYTCGRNN